jgi:hypothetical protein
MLNQHNITSARYAEPEPQGGYAADAPVIATRNGTTEYRRANDDIDGGGMLAYLAGGGTIDPYQPPPLDDQKATLVAAAWAECNRRIEAGQVDVTTSAGTHPYGLDKVTQDNVQKVLLGVLTNSTPNPRDWTPKNALAPISVTHADIGIIAAAVGNAYDAHIQAYLAHKAAIIALADQAAVDAYDVTTGHWPT